MDTADYRASLPYSGSASRALENAAITLTSIGFRITERTEWSVALQGPGMNSTKQNPVVGASLVELSIAEGAAHLAAELGGLRRLQRFVRLFPPLLMGGLTVVLGVVFIVTFGPGRWTSWALPLAVPIVLQGVIWAVVGPIMARSLENRVRTALDTLLQNTVMMSREA